MPRASFWEGPEQAECRPRAAPLFTPRVPHDDDPLFTAESPWRTGATVGLMTTCLPLGCHVWCWAMALHPPLVALWSCGCVAVKAGVPSLGLPGLLNLVFQLLHIPPALGDVRLSLVSGSSDVEWLPAVVRLVPARLLGGCHSLCLWQSGHLSGGRACSGSCQYFY